MSVTQTIRDAPVVRTQVCPACSREGPCGEGPRSVFPVNKRHNGLVVSWRPLCRRCSNAQARMNYVLRQERKGRPVHHHHTVIDNTAPRLAAGPFRAWLLAYGKATGSEGSDALGLRLGIEPRRVRGVISEQQASITIDVVDRALLTANRVVNVAGRFVLTLDDLYPLG